MPRAVLGLGSNLGARAAMLRGALALLRDQPGITVLAHSLVYETPPLGPPQPHYLNAALLVQWAGSLESLFALTCHVEQLLGRERRERWGPRTLDVDILLWSGGVVRTPALTVPHAGAFVRPFVLAPMADVLPRLAPELRQRLGEVGDAGPGRPLLDEPTVAEGEDLPCLDFAELLSAIVGALVPGHAGPCRAVVPFSLPSGEAAALGQLVRQVAELPTLGFQVRRAVVTEAGPGGYRGLFLGEHGPAASRATTSSTHFFADSERVWVRVERSLA